MSFQIERVSLLVNLEKNYTLLNGNLKLNCIYQCFLYKEKGELVVDIDLLDIEDITFMDMPVRSGYAEFNIWKENMLNIGINIDEIVNRNCDNEIVKAQITALIIEKYGNNNLDK